MLNERGAYSSLQRLFLRVALGATTLAALAVGVGFAMALAVYHTAFQ